MSRARARRADRLSSDKRRRYQDYFCLASGDVRVGYAYAPKLLRLVSRRARRGLRGRVIWVSTANRFYALHGVRPGARLGRVRRQLRVSRAFHVGRNFWYFTADGPSTGLIRVHRGVIEEIGIAQRSLLRSTRARRIFLRSLS